MILKIYKYKNNFISNHHNGIYYFLKVNDHDKMGIFSGNLKSIIREYKETKNYYYRTFEFLVIQNFDLINWKKYNSIEELEHEYIEELI